MEFIAVASPPSDRIVAAPTGVDDRNDLDQRSLALDMLDTLVWVDATANRLAAMKATAVNTLRLQNEALSEGNTPTARMIERRAFIAEIATALTISERAAESLVGTSAMLATDLPGTRAALEAGEISWRHAQIMVDHAAGLETSTIADLEARVLPSASKSTPPRFNSVVRKTRERLDPESTEKRHEVAIGERQVLLDDGRDGMVWLSANLSAPQAQAVFDRLTKAALALKAKGDARTVAQLRADILAAVLLANHGALSGETPELDDSEDFVRWFRGIRAEVIITVPALSLIGESDQPATLEGYGPIDLETARILAARAPSFIRILTHPETGVVLSVGRERYKVPKDLRTWLRIRDGTCRFPGCNRRAERCDIDHTAEWQPDGQTAHNNLAHLCRSHHTLKGVSQGEGVSKWAVAQAEDGGGALTWTSPAGRRYVTEPAVALPF